MAVVRPIVAASDSCAPRIYAAAGSYSSTRQQLHGPGLVLSGGGTDIDATFAWIHATLFANASAPAGNVVVLRAHGDNDYDAYMKALGPFTSVRTIVIPPCSTGPQVDALAEYVQRADAVFFAGGDQANYVRWKGTALMRAVRAIWTRNGVVGGTSAGLAVQGEIAYDSVAADRLHPNDDAYEVRTSNALPNPFEPEISFTTGMLEWPPLANIITDSHFARRDRFGRLVTFLARLEQERHLPAGTIYGLGVDERSSLVVDKHGVGTLIEYRGSGYQTRGAYLVHLVNVKQLSPSLPLIATVDVVHLDRAGDRLNLFIREARTYRVTVNGGISPPYSRDPY